MNTQRIYQNNAYKKNATATILSANYDKKNAEIILDQTIFFPTGGGQSCDLGSVKILAPSQDNPDAQDTYSVIDVYEKGDAIVHVLEGSSSIPSLQAGDTVSLTLDWDHRFDNMQRHCGEHILSGAIHRLFGGTNKGFHMGVDSITIDILFEPETAKQDPSGARYEKMTWEMAEAAEREANHVIQSNLPVSIDYFDTRKDAESYPLRKPLAFDEDISIVTIGTMDDPADCVACCGTHPASTGEIGLLKIYKIEPNKGMSRIYFECGGRALSHYEAQFNVLYDLGNRLSSGFDELLQKYEAQEQRQSQLREELRQFRSRALKAEAEQILSTMRDKAVYQFEDFSVDDLLNLGKSLHGKIEGMIALVHSPTQTVILLSDADKKSPEDLQCGQLVKTKAKEYEGRGGGSPNAARVFFPDTQLMERFLSDQGFSNI